MQLVWLEARDFRNYREVRVELGPGLFECAGTLMEQYEDLPMDFADATLVALAEAERTHTVFTLDRPDFSVYKIGRKPFQLLPNR